MSTKILIGPFRRRVFAEGLARMLENEPDLEVGILEREEDTPALMDSPTPLVVILESRADSGQIAFIPRSEAVAVILISQEGQDVQIALRQVDRSRLKAAIGLVAQVPHPRMISLDTDPPSQAPFALPNFRRSETSGLSRTLAWLDACFARALQGLAAERGADAGAGWLGDLDQLLRGFAAEGAVTPEREHELFAALLHAPGWHVRLTRLFALDPCELKLICLAAAPDLDQRYAQAVGLLQNDYAQPRPNATTLARLLGEDHVGADISALMAGRRSFARLAMIRAEELPLPQPGYHVAPELIATMTGLRRHGGPGWRLQTDALSADEHLADELAAILQAPAPPVIVATGEVADLGDEIAAAAVASGCAVLRADCQTLGEDIGRAVLDRALEARLRNAALMFEHLDALEPGRRAAVLGADIEGLVRAVIVAGGSAFGPVSRDALTLRVTKPGIRVVARRWQAAAEDHGLELSPDEAQRLGGTLRLRAADIDMVVRLAAGRRRIGAEAADEVLILEAARSLAARHAPETVRRAPAMFRWRDIVLPETLKTQVAGIPQHVRHASRVLDDWDFASRLPYGRGVGALFSGPSGTGKTMCAQVIARELGVDVMQVELSRCVSKYIGETEKNIDRCFAAAEAASAVLLFDESDALFGKRTEIKDSHDRHANVEVAYLLQRIEAYEGLVILTTNLKANIDPAFLRRLRFVCDFPMPEAADRERIWQLAIPRAARCASDVDTAFLARRLPLSGGSIQSIAVNAGFGAAAEDCDAIHMRHIMAATRAELLKNGMLSAERALADPEPAAIEGAGS